VTAATVQSRRAKIRFWSAEAGPTSPNSAEGGDTHQSFVGKGETKRRVRGKHGLGKGKHDHRPYGEHERKKGNQTDRKEDARRTTTKLPRNVEGGCPNELPRVGSRRPSTTKGVSETKCQDKRMKKKNLLVTGGQGEGKGSGKRPREGCSSYQTRAVNRGAEEKV